jgi:hypothetical protein
MSDRPAPKRAQSGRIGRQGVQVPSCIVRSDAQHDLRDTEDQAVEPNSRARAERLQWAPSVTAWSGSVTSASLLFRIRQRPKMKSKSPQPSHSVSCWGHSAQAPLLLARLAAL